MSGLGITAGAHRLWAHRAYKATLPLKILLTTFNTIAFQDCAIHWARDHRVHHKYSETDADPHNATRYVCMLHQAHSLCAQQALENKWMHLCLQWILLCSYWLAVVQKAPRSRQQGQRRRSVWSWEWPSFAIPEEVSHCISQHVRFMTNIAFTNYIPLLADDLINE